MIAGRSGFLLRAFAYAGDSRARRARLTGEDVKSYACVYTWDRHTFEHILALTIENTCSHLQVLLFQELRNCECFWFRRTGINGLLLLLLLGLSLLLLSCLLLCHGLCLYFLYELWDGHSCFLRIQSKLPLHSLYLLGRWLLSWLQSNGLPLSTWRGLLTRHYDDMSGWLERARRYGDVDMDTVLCRG